MDASEFARSLFEDAGYQLAKVLEGIDEEYGQYKITPSSKSPSETCEHLADTYTAFLSELAGNKYEWGTFKPSGAPWPAAWHEALVIRNGVAESLKGELSNHQLNVAANYIIAHDYYHVGQMCQARIAFDPKWDPYSIYRM